MQDSHQPIADDDRTIGHMLRDAHLPSLMPALAHLMGDLSLISRDLRPPLPRKPIPPAQGGMSEAQQERARALAFEALRRYRDAGCPPPPPADEAALRRIMDFLTGDDVSDDCFTLLCHELALPEDRGQPGWTKSELAPERDFTVAVIGAGMSGLGAAHRLAQAGVPFVVLEHNAEVGGTWLVNRYPGCRLDTSNYCYSYSFFQRPDWPYQFSTRDSIYEYFKRAAERLDLRRHIRFRTEVVSAAFDDATCTWRLRLNGPHGEEDLVVNAVISAVGQLNRPAYPDIPGRDSFAGDVWHTATWDETASLAGRRVAVIGTGASAYQVIPEIAEQVAELRVFQRSAPWAMPTPTYHDEVPEGLRWLFRHVPYYHRWFRFYQFWTGVEGRRPFAKVDPEWTGEGSISADNEALRQALVAHMEEQYADRPDLLEKVIPDYPPYAKRMLMDNGVWAAALKKDHVELVTDRIERIDETGIVTRDGARREVDAIVYGTGFDAWDFLNSVRVEGRGGADLHRQWNGDARAYLGISIPNFPNLFCVYGPNTNLVVNGSLFMFTESAVEYIMECLGTLLRTGHRAMEVEQDAFDAYNDEIDAANRQMAWGLDGVTNWYKNASGRVSQNWPLSTVEYWRRTRRPEAAHYRFL